MLKKYFGFIGIVVISLAGCVGVNFFDMNNGKIADQPPTDSIESEYSETADLIKVVAAPDNVPVLVNKRNKLPDGYEPSDLVDAKVPFIFKEQSLKRKMRAEAADAIEKLFAAAEQEGVMLLGVSAYRSSAAQEALFNLYVNRDGYKAAATYSAMPRMSEHETGLAIDVTGASGKCAAEDCFGGTPEAKWLEKNAAKFGFIIRYPKGKEVITGYQYEPWHLRYVGKPIAKEITERRITLEEYYNAVLVNN